MDKIVCVGKNYPEHAKELGEPVPEKPVIFLKPPSVLKQSRSWSAPLEAQFPKNSGEVHYECEIVLKLGANRAVEAVTLGLDMTLRERQTILKKNGHPWTTGKVFKDAAILAPWILLKEFPTYMGIEFSFAVDGVVKQKGCGNEMRMKPNEILAYVEGFFPLCPGDVIFTGTPAGVGPIGLGQIGTISWGTRNQSVTWK